MAKKDEFDKKEVFERDFDPPLNEIRIGLNRERIPFLFVAAVANDQKKTEYRVKIDANRRDGDMRDETLVCGGITPGAIEVDLHDDRIRELVKVLNGCRAELPASSLEFSEEDFPSMQSVFTNNRYAGYDAGKDEYYMPEEGYGTASAADTMEIDGNPGRISSRTAAAILYNEDEEWARKLGLKEPAFDLIARKRPRGKNTAAGTLCFS